MGASSMSRVSVIVRIHEGASLSLLDEALFSIANAHRQLKDGSLIDVEPVLVVQMPSMTVAPDAQSLRPYRQLLNKHLRPNHHPPPMAVVPNPDGRDLRSLALNCGLQQATGRYVAFLDYDDVVYPACYVTLVGELIEGSDVLAAGGVIRARVEATENGPYVRQKQPWLQLGTSQGDLLQNNFLPLHSFVIDKTRVKLTEAWFDIGLTRLEDYDFLLRLAARGTFNFNRLAVPVCEYRLISRHSAAPVLSGDFAPTNVNPLSNRDVGNLAAWHKAKLHIELVKQIVTNDILANARLVAQSPSQKPVRQPLTPTRWLKAMTIAVEQSGGAWSMVRRVASLTKSMGIRGVLRRAMTIVRRV